MMAVAILALAGCEKPQAWRAPWEEFTTDPAKYRTAGNRYSLYADSRRYSIEIPSAFTVHASKEWNVYSGHDRIKAIDPDHAAVSLLAHYRYLGPSKREGSVLASLEKDPSLRRETTMERVARLSGRFEERCGGRVLPSVPPVRTADGRTAYVLLRCRNGADFPAGATAIIDDARVIPSLSASNGDLNRNWLQEVIVPDLLEEFLVIVRSYRSGG
jgi:hypothetical protein